MWHPWRLVDRRDALSGISWSILQGRRRCRCDVTYLGHLVISEPPFQEMKSLAALEISWKPTPLSLLFLLLPLGTPNRRSAGSRLYRTYDKIGVWLNLNFHSIKTLCSRTSTPHEIMIDPRYPWRYFAVTFLIVLMNEVKVKFKQKEKYKPLSYTKGRRNKKDAQRAYIYHYYSSW